MAISAINFDSSSGLKSVQDLYEMINGKTTSTSGGGSVVKTESGISQASMDAMLKSALEGTNGLAAVSGGQRAAGGYGSVTNQLLTNDLLTRSAAAVAASAQSKTVTTTNSPTKTTAGGASVGGVAKTAGFLQAIKLLSGITGSKDKKSTDEESDFNSLVNNGGVQQAGFNSPSSESYATHQGTGSSVDDISAFSEQTDSGTVFEDAGYSPQSAAVQEESFTPTVEDTVDYSTPLWIPEGDTARDYAVGGEVSTSESPKGKILGTSQFNTVIDPAVAARGSKGVGFNESNPVGQMVAANSASGGSGGDSESNPVSANSGSGNNAGINLSDLSSIGKALSISGSLAGSKELGQLGTVLGIAGSSNPALSAVRAGLNIATKGASGAIEKIGREKSAASVADVVIGVSNPVLATINGILGLAGKASLGNIGANAFSAMDKDSWIGLQDIAERNPNSSGMARASNNMDGNPLDNLTGIIQTGVTPTQAAFKGAVAESSGIGKAPTTDTLQALLDSNNAFGTGGSSMSESNINATNNANAGGGDALDNLMSETGAFGTADTGQQTSGGQSVSDYSGSPGDGSTYAAVGGELHGPGTGTSDSIKANVSDGETIVTAQTTAKVKELFGDDFFHNLEVQFNKPAAIKQKQMGRA